MDLRVTSQSQTMRASTNLQRQIAIRARLDEEMSSGVKLQKPSDNPADFSIVSAEKISQLAMDGYINAIASSTENLNESVSTLTDAQKLVARAKNLAVEANNGQLDTRSLEAYAQEIDGVITRMIDLGNQQLNGRYLYAGAKSDTPPFAVTATNSDGKPTAITYAGSIERSQTVIGPNQTVDTHYDGSKIFQNANGNVFQSLMTLRDQLRDTSLTPIDRANALTSSIDNLSKASDMVLDGVGEQSTSLNNLEAVNARFTTLKLNSQIRSNEMEGTDYSVAIVQFQQQESVYQATLATTSRLFDQSLLDFIR